MTTLYTLAEVAKNNGENGARVFIVVRDVVYDVTNYLNEHPGGAELIEECAGKDASAAFEDAGHSSDAEKILKRFKVGELVDEDKRANRKKNPTKGKTSVKKTSVTQRQNLPARRAFLSVLCGRCA